MTYYSEDPYLSHYGVKGMKWGVRHDRDSSGASDRSAAKAQRREAKAQKFDRDAELYRKAADRTTDQAMRNDLLRRSERARKNAEAVRNEKLTSGQKKALVAAALVAAYATYKVVDSGEARRVIAMGKNFVDGKKLDEVDWATGSVVSTLKNSDAVFSAAHARINPNYGSFGTTNNCRRCTFAYELNRRGYDVGASKTFAGTGQNSSGVYRALKKGRGAAGVDTTIGMLAKSASDKGFRDFMSDTKSGSGLGEKKVDKYFIGRALSNMPVGARGELGMAWDVGGGHSMAWEVFEDGLRIMDIQAGKSYVPTDKEFIKLTNRMSSAAITRLDNKDLNYNFLRKWVTSDH